MVTLSVVNNPHLNSYVHSIRPTLKADSVMKHLSIKLLLCLLVPLLFSSCDFKQASVLSFSKKDFKNAPTKIIRTGSFDKIENNGPYFIEYVQSPEYKLELKGNTALFDSITYFNEAQKLCFGMKPGDYSNVWLKVTVYAPYIKSACLHGTGSIFLGNIKFNKDFKIISDAPGDIRADTIQCNLFEVEASGPGAITVSKLKSKSQNIKSSGPGDVKINS